MEGITEQGTPWSLDSRIRDHKRVQKEAKRIWRIGQVGRIVNGIVQDCARK